MPLSLSADQVRAYHRDGLLSPVPVLGERECERFRSRFAELESAVGPASPDGSWTRNPHLHFGWCWDLVTWPVVLDAVQDLIGGDILVLSSILFVKKPGQRQFVSWHQDSRFFRRDGRPLRALTGWIALAPSTLETGCLLGLPASHTEGYLPHDFTYEASNMLRRGETVRAGVDESCAVAMVLEAGEMSLHHIDTLHASHVNEGPTARIGLAVRYVHPETALTVAHAPVVLARGTDAFGLHDTCPDRPPDDLRSGLASLAEVEAAPVQP
jgi:hypothetical protein